MHWGKAGRPRNPDKKPRKNGFTRQEMRVAKDKRDGMRMLACAVLKQWIEDGRPGDLPESWVDVLEALL